MGPLSTEGNLRKADWLINSSYIVYMVYKWITDWRNTCENVHSQLPRKPPSVVLRGTGRGEQLRVRFHLADDNRQWSRAGGERCLYGSVGSTRIGATEILAPERGRVATVATLIHE